MVVNLTTMGGMATTSPFSLRMDARGRARLAAIAGRRQQSQHELALRLVEEGLRMIDHPGIVFRDGPSGRRAGLAAGPDVSEVIDGIRGASGDTELDAAAHDGGLTRQQVDVAVRYYGEFTDEIDERIRLNAEEGDRRLALFLAGRDALV